MNNSDGIDIDGIVVDWDEVRRHARLPHVRAWRFLRYDVPHFFAALVCRTRGHRWEGGEYWTDCGKEYWAVCRRCGEDMST